MPNVQLVLKVKSAAKIRMLLEMSSFYLAYASLTPTVPNNRKYFCNQDQADYMPHDHSRGKPCDVYWSCYDISSDSVETEQLV